MTEDESYRERPEFIIGRIDAIEHLQHLIIATMPGNQRDFIVESMHEYRRNMEEIADRQDTDAARDRQSAAFEVVMSLEHAMEDWVEAFNDASG